MGFEVVCISRSLAAGGEGVGFAVAERLGFRYIDEQVITRAAEQARVDPKLVAATEQRRPLLERIIDKLGNAQDLAGVVTLGTGVPFDVFGAGAPHSKEDDLRIMIRAAIHEIAKAGKAVIVAHAASMALAGMDGVLRILITASADTRSQRLATDQAMTAAAATAAIAKSDRDRADYFVRFYQIKAELPTHYDLVINTDVLSAEQAIQLITGVVKS